MEKKNSNTEASRIDYFLTSREITTKLIKTDIRPAMIKHTDHLAVSIIIDNTNPNRGPGYWKFNKSLLSNKEYKELIKNIIKNYNTQVNNKTIDANTAWELCKIEIKETPIAFSKKIAKTSKNEVEEIEKSLQKLNEKQESENNTIIKNELETKLENLYSKKAYGAQIRSRVNWIEKGEKNTKYFLSLEKKRQIKKAITKINNENEILLTKQEDVLKGITQYYKKLYTTNNTDRKQILSYIENTQIENKLKKEESQSCDGLIKTEEIKEAINHMKLNKSPGIDGLTVEFYKEFWPQLEIILLKSFNESFNKNELTTSQKQGILSLLYKKGDPLNLKNWRPITLLNTDYKILARCLAQRMKAVLPQIINSDQNGFIKGRYIG